MIKLPFWNRVEPSLSAISPRRQQPLNFPWNIYQWTKLQKYGYGFIVMSSFFIVGTWLSCNGIHLVLSAFSLVDSHKWVSVQSDCGLTSKSLQKNFSQSHLIVERLFNNVLKIRQNPSSKTLRKMAVKITIFLLLPRKTQFQQNNNFRQEIPSILYIYIYIAQVTQQCVCLRILFPRRFPSFIFFKARYLKEEIVQNLLTYLKKKKTKQQQQQQQ